MSTKPSRATLQARATIAELRTELDASFAINVKLRGDLAEARQALDLEVARSEELEKNNADIGQQLVDQGATIAAMNKEGGTLRYDNAALRKERDAAAADANFVRDSMHALELDRARLEGQLQRVREFDPVTDQQTYRDCVREVMNRNGFGERAAMTASPAWYRRG